MLKDLESIAPPLTDGMSLTFQEKLHIWHEWRQRIQADQHAEAVDVERWRKRVRRLKRMLDNVSEGRGTTEMQ
jgi:hypothetical protein